MMAMARDIHIVPADLSRLGKKSLAFGLANFRNQIAVRPEYT